MKFLQAGDVGGQLREASEWVQGDPGGTRVKNSLLLF